MYELCYKQISIHVVCALRLSVEGEYDQGHACESKEICRLFLDIVERGR